MHFAVFLASLVAQAHARYQNRESHKKTPKDGTPVENSLKRGSTAQVG
jgi:hypothetical protein